jgi:hypothetical protein
MLFFTSFDSSRFIKILIFVLDRRKSAIQRYEYIDVYYL